VNYARIALAALAASVSYFALGAVFFALSPLAGEFRKYPAVYRTMEDMKAVMPIGMLATVLSIAVLAILFALAYQGGSGVFEGARFGALIGLFAVGSFVLHNYVNLNIGLALTVGQAVAYLIQWTVVGVIIGLIYRPATT
jgi:branched-subunit amino acid transport protein AzlD